MNRNSLAIVLIGLASIGNSCVNQQQDNEIEKLKTRIEILEQSR